MSPAEWAELQRNLEATIPVYDRINRFATMRQDRRWRGMVRDRLPTTGNILEVGCGPGTFAEMIPDRELTCLDPIPAMLAVAEKRVNSARQAAGQPLATFVEATAEEMPFEDASFDAVCSLFSFRDWYDKRAGLAEVKRVLRPGGTLVIVDPAKMNRFHGWLGWLYMRVWVGTYARIVCRQKDHPWKWLTRTYTSFGTTKTYVKMLNEMGFTEVKAKVIFPGMATIWTSRLSE
jgi:demethylmenaquinone methyltransferase/2-methoxy-6-polyprenyl-1,4-benzoquinol methylase